VVRQHSRGLTGLLPLNTSATRPSTSASPYREKRSAAASSHRCRRGRSSCPPRRAPEACARAAVRQEEVSTVAPTVAADPGGGAWDGERRGGRDAPARATRRRGGTAGEGNGRASTSWQGREERSLGRRCSRPPRWRQKRRFRS
jgi:hypothetical protein